MFVEFAQIRLSCLYSRGCHRSNQLFDKGRENQGEKIISFQIFRLEREREEKRKQAMKVQMEFPPEDLALATIPGTFNGFGTQTSALVFSVFLFVSLFSKIYLLLDTTG